jgi:hypothetical protein
MPMMKMQSTAAIANAAARGFRSAIAMPARYVKYAAATMLTVR